MQSQESDDHVFQHFLDQEHASTTKAVLCLRKAEGTERKRCDKVTREPEMNRNKQQKDLEC